MDFLAWVLAVSVWQGAQTPPPPTPPPLPQVNPPPTRADILRGEYGRYRANNDLLYYHLDVRVDPDEEVDQRQEHDPLQDAQGRHAHPARSLRQPEHRQDRPRDDTASSTSARSTPSSSTFPQTLKAGQHLLDRLLLFRHAEEVGRFGGMAFRRTRPATTGSSPPAKATAPPSGGPTRISGTTKSRRWTSASRSPTTSSTSRTARSSARPISATATRAGTGTSTIRSTTTTCR